MMIFKKKQEEKMAEKKEAVREEVKAEVKRDFIVVNELPTQPVKNVIGEDGVQYEILTSNDALKEILESVRELKKLL
jgi:hypothetical protein